MSHKFDTYAGVYGGKFWSPLTHSKSHGETVKPSSRSLSALSMPWQYKSRVGPACARQRGKTHQLSCTYLYVYYYQAHHYLKKIKHIDVASLKHEYQNIKYTLQSVIRKTGRSIKCITNNHHFVSISLEILGIINQFFQITKWWLHNCSSRIRLRLGIDFWRMRHHTVVPDLKIRRSNLQIHFSPITEAGLFKLSLSKTLARVCLGYTFRILTCPLVLS